MDRIRTAILAPWAGIVLLIGYSDAADCATLPVSSPAADCAGYTSLKDAAIEALRRAAEIDAHHEYAGALFEDGGRYCFTTAVSNGENDYFDIHIRLPRRAKLVALYHTHPARYGTDLFSPNDVQTAQDLRLKSFIYVVSEHTVKLFDPEKDVPEPLYKGDLRHLFAHGEIVAVVSEPVASADARVLTAQRRPPKHAER